jgi:chromosome partitioning protein
MTQIPPRISALLNQKGGVGKTTSTVSIGAAIALLGRRTLLIDLDPQAHLSLHLGVDGSSVGKTVYDALVEPDCDIRDCLVQVRDNLWLLPSTTDLAGAETELAAHPDRNRILRERFEEIRGEFDFVLIDCPPSLSVLTLNGLCLADEVVVPMQAQFLAMQGLTKLLETVEILTQSLNPTLKVGGVVLCMHETQTSHSREVVQELAGFFDEHVGSGMPWDGAKVFMPAVRRNIKLAEAPSFGQTIFDYAPWCPGAIDYRALGERFVRDWELSHGVDGSIAGKPTPAAAALAAAAAATAAAAAAAAVQASRFTPETAAAARAAKAARTSSRPTPSVPTTPVATPREKKPAPTDAPTDAPAPASAAEKTPVPAKKPAAAAPAPAPAPAVPAKKPTPKASAETTASATPAPAPAAAKPAAVVEPRVEKKPVVKTKPTTTVAATPVPPKAVPSNPVPPKAVPSNPAPPKPSAPAAAIASSAAKPSPAPAPAASQHSDADPEPVDPSHPFRAATRVRGS